MKKVLTIILDGFGLRDETHGNAIKAADAKVFNELWKKYPHSELFASEEPIGLLKGQFGNSEIGHMTIGAGRTIKQDATRINELLATDMLEEDCFVELIKNPDQPIHLMGLVSDGMVHSDLNHLLSLFEKLANNGMKNINFHVITDGRDTKPDVAIEYIKVLEEAIKKLKVGKIVSVCGRYYAMDRNKNWDRTKIYYDLVTKGIGNKSTNIASACAILYKKNVTDEFFPPILIDESGLIKKGDKIFWFNYRTDRAKQIIETFVNADFKEFAIKDLELDVYSFVKIDKTLKTNFFLEDKEIKNSLGLYLAELGLSQARVAETEKYAHVTYFFDGEYNGPIEKGYRFLIPSPDVATYDLRPEMSAIPVTKKVISCMERDFDFILVNYANPDMVGHTGNMDAAIKAIMAVDLCLGKLIEEAENNFYKVIILADHGNADTMLDENNKPITTHSLAKVPFIIVDEKVSLKETGDLTQVASTILEYMDIAVPKEMKEKESLFKNDK